jgi:hypothetical protein
MWINSDIIQGTSIEHILEQPSSWSTSRIRPSWPLCRLRLNLLLVSLTEHAFCCHAHPVSCCLSQMGRISHLTPSLLSGWLLTNVQENNITMLHDTAGHIYITSALLFFSSPYTSSTLFGRLTSSDYSCLTQLSQVDREKYFQTWMKYLCKISLKMKATYLIRKSLLSTHSECVNKSTLKQILASVTEIW